MRNTVTARPFFTHDEMLLAREASLASMSLGVGLTHVGKYDYTQTGFFYSGMFSICIGLERVLKLILIYDHKLKHSGAFPSNNQLKNFGHKLDDLLKCRSKITEDHSLNVTAFEPNDELQKKIISFLTDFALTSRYYNLDTLTGRNHQADEPLARWDKEICTPIIDRHFKLTTKKKAEIKLISESMPHFAQVLQMSDSGKIVSDFEHAATESSKISTKQTYSRYYLYDLVRLACNTLTELEYKGGLYPHLREFFFLFMNDDKQWILRKKSWNPYPPYNF